MSQSGVLRTPPVTKRTGVSRSGGASAASGVSLVTHAAAYTATPSGTSTTSGIATTGSTLLVVGVTWFGTTSYQTLSDSINGGSGNTWTRANTYAVGNLRYCAFYYNSNPAVGPNHTFSAAAVAGGYPSLSVAAFSGTLVSGAPDINTKNGGGSLSGTLQPATSNQTPTHNGEVVVTVMQTNGAPPLTINQSFTTTDIQNPGAAMGMAYLVQTTAAAVNPTWTEAALTDGAAAIISFQA